MTTTNFLDVEVTTKNKGHPFTPENKLISYAYAINDDPVLFKYCTDPDFNDDSLKPNDSDFEYVGFHIKYDLHWLLRTGRITIQELLPVRIWCCQLAEFVLNNQQGAFLSLDEALASYGLEQKKDIVKEYWEQGIDTDKIPVPILQEYNSWDVQQTRELYKCQQFLLTEKQKNLVYLLGEDLKTLLSAEANGIKWDEDKANEKSEILKQKIKDDTERLSTYLPTINHGEFNWDSGDHLSVFLYGGVIDFDYVVSEDAVYKSGPNKGQSYVKNRHFTESVVFPGFFKPLDRTELKKTKGMENVRTRYYKTDEPTLLSLSARSNVKREIIATIIARAENIKILEMIVSIQKKRDTLGWTNNYIHAQFNQNVVITGRLSSSNPNMQNTPLAVDELLISAYAS